jgi:hypothetical protein
LRNSSNSLLSRSRMRLLVLAQLVHLALLAVFALMMLLSLRSGLSASTPLILALLECAIVKLLLLVDHVAELVERRHHVVIASHLLARLSHLQVLEHLLQFMQHSSRGVLGAGAGHLLVELVYHVPQILRTQLSRITVKRPRQLLRDFARICSAQACKNSSSAARS